MCGSRGSEGDLVHLPDLVRGKTEGNGKHKHKWQEKLHRVKPVKDEQVFYDKFLCDKFYLLVCTRNFENFFYDKCTCSKASMLAF